MNNLALLLVLALCMSQPLITNASWFTQRYVIHIENRLSNQTLQAHCTSEDQDLGLQHISLGEQFQWVFYIPFWRNKVYMCNLSWSGGYTNLGVVTLNACDPGIFWKSDLNCVFRAKDDGLYSFDSREQKDYFIHWWGHW
jgi:hypothetical protein